MDNNSTIPDGASKSPGAVDIGSGGAVVGKDDKVLTAASLPRSAKNDSKNISPAQALEILQQAIVNAQRAGIEIQVISYYSKKHFDQVIVVLDRVKLDYGNLHLEADHA